MMKNQILENADMDNLESIISELEMKFAASRALSIIALIIGLSQELFLITTGSHKEIINHSIPVFYFFISFSVAIMIYNLSLKIKNINKLKKKD